MALSLDNRINGDRLLPLGKEEAKISLLISFH